LVGDGLALTYREMARYARAIAGALGSSGRPGSRVAILGSRSVAACLGVLGTCWSGATYAPLGLKLPEERLAALLRSSGFDALICDGKGETLLTEAILEAAPDLILLADFRNDREWQDRRFWRLTKGEEGGAPTGVGPDDLAYIEFTSGTTGVPKGVMIPAAAVHHYISVMQDRYALTPDERVVETTDLSFDVSVSNMFLPWNAAAALYILPAASMLSAVKFVRDNRLTMWFSVPSVIAILRNARTLRPGSMPSLRRSFFAGEPLPGGAAEAWLEAAPNSKLDNLYGPTEATIVCLRQEATKPLCLTEQRGIVALGRVFPGMDVAILDEAHRFLERGVEGEIALSGPQLAAGYLNLPELTTARFPIIDGRRWYLTGDWGYQDDQGIFHHLGRIDNQVKVRGNRVELEEVEVHLRRVGGTMSAAAVAWPIEYGSASGIVAFVAGAKVCGPSIKEAMRKSLPAYMAPSVVVELESLPLNASGKIDRLALAKMLNENRQ